jgi:hypothetical protein
MKRVIGAIFGIILSTAAHAQYRTPAVNSPLFPSTPSSGQFPAAQSSTTADWKSMSGDATLAATGALTIGANAVTNAKAAQMTANTVKCNPTGSTANAQDCTSQQTQSVLNATQCLNIASTQFGGAGNNSTDNTTPLNNALAALTGNGGCIYFPPGKYKFNSAITYSLTSGIFSVDFVGSGQDNTILTWPNASGGMAFTLPGLSSSVHFRDMSLTTAQNGGGTAVSLTSNALYSNPANSAISDFYRVTFRGDDGYSISNFWNTDVSILNVSNVQVENGTFVSSSAGNAGTGINTAGNPGSNGSFEVVLNVAKSTFTNVGTGINYGAYVQGITIDQTNFVGGGLGVFSTTGLATNLSMLSISNSQCGFAATACIQTGTQVLGMNLVNNFFFQAANQDALNLTNTAHFTVVGNSFVSQSTTGTNGVIVGTSAAAENGGVIEGNTFVNYATAVSLGAGSKAINVSNNIFFTNTVNVTDSGTGNTGTDVPFNTFTPSLSCGTATFTTNSAHAKTIGKITYIGLDATIATIGAGCASTTNVQLSLPNTSAASIALDGKNITTGKVVACHTTGASGTAFCSYFDGTNGWAATDRIVLSGVYENQ